MNRLIARFGFWSAILSFIFGAGYIVAQLASFAGIPAGAGYMITLMFPSFWLALVFVILMASIYHYAPEERKIWGFIAVIFAVMYATLNTSVYFLQMTVLYPLTLTAAAERVSFLLFSPSPSFVYGLDALGYALMSLATLFAAPVFVGPGLARRVRWALIANGVLFPALLVQQNFPVAFDIGALWVITFPVANALLVLFFKRACAEAES